MSQNDKQNDVYDAAPDSGYDESYDATFAEGDDYVEEAADGEWADESHDSAGNGEADSEQPPPKKKRSNLTIFLILLVAIVGVFGIMILKGGKKAPVDQAPIAAPVVVDSNAMSQPTPMPAGNEPVAAPSADPQQATAGVQPAPQIADQQGGVMNNPDVLNQAVVTSPNGAVPSPASQASPSQQSVTPNQVAPVGQAAPAPTMTGVVPQTSGNIAVSGQVSVAPVPGAPSDTNLVKAITPEVKPVSDFPKVDVIKKADIPQPTAVAKVDASSPAPALAPSTLTVPSDAPIKAVQSQLDAALEKISRLEKDVSDREARLQEQSQKSVAVPSEVKELKEKIAALEEKLAAKKSTQRDQGGQVVPNPARTEHKVVVKRHVAVSRAVPTSSAHPSSVWVLKSAKPGVAVIRSAATGDFKSVKVGDVVTGIGRITSIRETSTGWVVQGTQGFLGE